MECLAVVPFLVIGCVIERRLTPLLAKKVVWLGQSVAKMPQYEVAPSHLLYPLHLVFLLLESKIWLGPAHLEQTIAAPLEFAGIGLHSGAPVTMRLLPAPAGSGIVFRRTDLDNFEIPAIGRNVAKVSYATSLMRQGVLISTTEHLLSALIGMGVDNVIVELDNLELPILDGSAQPYVEAFPARRHPHSKAAARDCACAAPRGGARGQQVHRHLSGKRYNIRYSIDFPAPIGHQSTSVDLAAETYGTEIAPARTFGYKADEQRLRDMGLIRGATTENAIVLGAGGPENGPLRFADEYVRHKVLDLIGDLALAGRRIEGQVVAERAGHAMHTALVSRLLKDRSAWELAHVPVAKLSPNETAAASLPVDPLSNLTLTRA